MSLIHEQSAFLLDVCELIEFATSKGFLVTGGELERKIEMQEIYFKTGKTKTMDSKHLKKCAIDLNFFIMNNGKYELTYDVNILKPLGDFWESLNSLNSWGGSWITFKDSPHFERRV